MDAIDPSRCPICQESNACAMELAKAAGTSAGRCWCFDAVFSEDVMDLVPLEAQGKACICARCAAQAD
jgi:hypothetical protein